VIGPDSNIEAGAVVAGDVTTGPRCISGANVTVGDSTRMGTDVRLETGARILANTTIGDRVTVAANAVVGTPTASSVSAGREAVVDADSVIGAGAIVSASVRIGTRAVVRPGAVVMSDVPPKAIIAGNPARILGYADTSTRTPVETGSSAAGGDPVRTALGVGGCELWTLPSYRDLRGSLVPIEFSDNMPFTPARTFFVFDVPGEEVRGEHAHRECAQFLIAVHGALSVVVDDGVRATEIRLDLPALGLHIPPAIWGVQYKFQADAVLRMALVARTERR
jgi:acetyltransferase-like isoleucine patch superfamily enzyme